MMYRALKEVGGAEAQMLSWQHSSLNFVKNICGFDSIRVCTLMLRLFNDIRYRNDF